MTPDQEIHQAALGLAVEFHGSPGNKYGSDDNEVMETAKAFVHFIETGELPKEEDDEEEQGNGGEAHEPVAEAA